MTDFQIVFSYFETCFRIIGDEVPIELQGTYTNRLDAKRALATYLEKMKNESKASNAS